MSNLHAAGHLPAHRVSSIDDEDFSDEDKIYSLRIFDKMPQDDEDIVKPIRADENIAYPT